MRDWTKIKYYPVSIEKLQQASIKEVAYLIAPVNIGVDYEYFDEVKHLLDIPEEPKTVEQIQQELNDKIDELIVKTKRKYFNSKQSAEYRFNQFCENQDYLFEQAKNYGYFPNIRVEKDWSKYLLFSSDNNVVNWEPTLSLMPKDSVGYYEITPEYRVGLKQKPSAFVRFMSRVFMNWVWKDT